ncbi:MAG: hypothetical protein JSS66_00330 [Armatimonadetes bacterium]|nr:hypothetical protein [Armatimonadota bacterium]
MQEDRQQSCSEASKGPGWGLVGVAAFVGLAAAAFLLVNTRRRSETRTWSFEDLIDAADAAAARLERGLAAEAV